MKVELRDQIIPCWIEKFRPESHCDGRETSARLDSMQLTLALESGCVPAFSNSTQGVQPFKAQLLKWVGNKQRFAHEIISYFPKRFGKYHEPFLGSGAVLGVLAPQKAEASDSFGPLIAIWRMLRKDPGQVKEWYRERWEESRCGDKVEQYEKIKARYNSCANAADFLFLTRAAYGGVMRFRKADGYMSTPCGVHEPIHFETFGRRVDEWAFRVRGAEFFLPRIRRVSEPGARRRFGLLRSSLRP